MTKHTATWQVYWKGLRANGHWAQDVRSKNCKLIKHFRKLHAQNVLFAEECKYERVCARLWVCKTRSIEPTIESEEKKNEANTTEKKKRIKNEEVYKENWM